MKVLVTGGGGFLGRRIVELLTGRGDTVTFLARGHYPEVEQSTGATGLRIDLCDAAAVADAVAGHDAVIHVAAKAGFWGDRSSYWAINVDGTRNLIDAMEAHEVKRLVYTSTPSVVGYDHDLENADQNVPYAAQHGSPYPESKAEAERIVLEANSHHLATVSLRPHLIFGPRDTNLMPRVIDRARSGRLVIVGDGCNKVDMTYVDNAAWAHLDALDALTDHTAPCAGKAYFISNDEPVLLWDWLNDFFVEVGVRPLTRKVGLRTVEAIGQVMETAYRLLPLRGEPRMTRFVAQGLGRSHWYDMGPAKNDFGYHVRVPMEQATHLTTEWFNQRPDGPAI